MDRSTEITAPPGLPPAAPPALEARRPKVEAPVLLFDRVSKWYGPVLGVNQVTLELRGGITGLVGANGAGKTTLLRLATGQLRPDIGVAEQRFDAVAEAVVHSDHVAVRRKLRPLAGMELLQLSGRERSNDAVLVGQSEPDVPG